MPDTEPTGDVRSFDSLEREIVYLLTEQCPTVWSVADLGRELDYYDPNAVIRPLRCAGLLHRLCEGFVVATPAAFNLVGLTGTVV